MGINQSPRFPLETRNSNEFLYARDINNWIRKKRLTRGWSGLAAPFDSTLNAFHPTNRRTCHGKRAFLPLFPSFFFPLSSSFFLLLPFSSPRGNTSRGAPTNFLIAELERRKKKYFQLDPGSLGDRNGDVSMERRSFPREIRLASVESYATGTKILRKLCRLRSCADIFPEAIDLYVYINIVSRIFLNCLLPRC